MNEMKLYKLNKESIEKDFNFTKSGLKHSQCKEFKMLPYPANDKKIFSKFDGTTGAFSRILSNKQLKNEFDSKEFVESVISQIGEFEGEYSEEAFKDIIKTMFINEDKLVDFDIKTINYISSMYQEEKNADFIYSVLADESLKEIVKEKYNVPNSNILYNLVIQALPELKDKLYSDEGYKCYLPFIKELFIKDFKFLISNEELYKNSLQRFLEYYVMFYISQLAIKLNKFEKADITKPDSIYYTLGFESISQTRTAYRFGWENLKMYVDTLFSHAITLELLNHNNLEHPLGYLELAQIFNNINREQIEEDLRDLCEQYKKRKPNVKWSEFNKSRESSGNFAFDKVYELYDTIYFQFQNSATKRQSDAYKNWFIKFVQDNFGKRRGSLGYCLSLDEEDIILLTKICINTNEKLKLSVLFEEFANRGISFDKDSKMKIVQLYEKLNLLEKKSDSGDAQYVRSIL